MTNRALELYEKRERMLSYFRKMLKLCTEILYISVQTAVDVELFKNDVLLV